MPTTFHSATHHDSKTFSQKTCIAVGAVLLLLGAFGFEMSNLFGMHMSFTHSAILLVSGIIAMSVGLMKRVDIAFRSSLVLSVFYGVLGVAGLVLGTPGTASIRPYDHDAFLLQIVPGIFELTSSDHGFHLIVTAILFISALTPSHSSDL